MWFFLKRSLRILIHFRQFRMTVSLNKIVLSGILMNTMIWLLEAQTRNSNLVETGLTDSDEIWFTFRCSWLEIIGLWRNKRVRERMCTGYLSLVDLEQTYNSTLRIRKTELWFSDQWLWRMFYSGIWGIFRVDILPWTWMKHFSPKHRCTLSDYTVLHSRR